MHISPQQYLINYRLEKARNLLKSTNLSISEISEQVGYPDPLSFSKIFKMYYKISPTEYRNQTEELVNASKKGE
jgi:AraC-like DNA-binding protein